MCNDADVLAMITKAIDLRCLETWAHKGSSRIMEDMEAVTEDDKCRLEISILEKEEKDSSFPYFKDDCVTTKRPGFCSLEAYFAWPLGCVMVASLC